MILLPWTSRENNLELSKLSSTNNCYCTEIENDIFAVRQYGIAFIQTVLNTVTKHWNFFRHFKPLIAFQKCLFFNRILIIVLLIWIYVSNRKIKLFCLNKRSQWVKVNMRGNYKQSKVFCHQVILSTTSTGHWLISILFFEKGSTEYWIAHHAVPRCSP